MGLQEEARGEARAIAARRRAFRRIAAAAAAMAFAGSAMVSHAVGPAATAGDSHTVGLRSDGTLRAWGNDRQGELGLGQVANSAVPLRVSGMPPVKLGRDAICAGFESAYAIASDGSLWSWGAGGDGQLGDGQNADRPVPARVAGISGVVSIGAGGSHAAAVTTDGSVWTWGGNQHGQLGDGSLERNVPGRVPGLTGFVAVAAGVAHTIALRGDGTVWAWGSNLRGQLGDGTTTDRTAPVQVKGLAGVKRIAAGAFHNAALASDGSVWTWGSGSGGALGDSGSGFRALPFRIPGIVAVDVSAAGTSTSGFVTLNPGVAVTLAVLPDGTVWGWGYTPNNTPGQVPYLASVVQVSGDAVALRSDGTVLVSAPAPVVPGISGAVAVSGSNVFGSDFRLASTADGSLYSWGSNSRGQLGIGGEPQRSTPAVVPGIDGVAQVAAGSGFTAALRGDGSVWAWGSNLGAVLGYFGPANSTPAAISGISGVTQIATGEAHIVALRSDGTVWTWGDNSWGEWGDGTAASDAGAPRPYGPRQVPGLADVVRVGAGGGTSFAIRRDGSLWAWGRNSLGQTGIVASTTCGPDFSTNSSVPVPCVRVPTQVPGLSNVVRVAASFAHALAVRSDGTVWTWGDNATGELGDGTIVSRPYAAPVPGLSNIGDVAAGGSLCLPACGRGAHSLALAKDGTVWSWGWNGRGQLGDGTIAQRTSPAQVAKVTGVVSIAAGLLHSVATRIDGTVLSWGANSDGQLGDGTFALRLRPVIAVREQGDGSVPTNDWYLDLAPGVGKEILPERIPVLLAVASGDTSASVLNLAVSILFRAQDLGKPIRFFAYTPASLAKRAKAGTDPCVLTQLTPAGPAAATPDGLQAFVGNVQSQGRQPLSILNNTPATPYSGSTICVGAGDTGAQAVLPSNSACVATVPPADTGGQVCGAPVNEVVANVPGALSGLWWNPAESGWGVDFTQRGNAIFAAWYTYDAAGNPKWYVASNCAMAGGGTSGTCAGSLFDVTGPRFFGAAFDATAVHGTASGSLQVSFRDASNATMTYTEAGQTRTVAITRQVFQSGGAAPAIDYTDLWWNPSESGWGLAVTQQYGMMFLAWFVYDDAGRPMWYVASSCPVNGAGNGCSGALFRTTGPAFGPTFDANKVTGIPAGTVSVSFTDANDGTLSYTVDGVSATKTITRQVF